ncbi:L,D-transpeptidase ErfK [Klebsiella pneumoniae]|uniref:L,D-transpeptidase ErfK n=1 Tax=Klebsiella pneumoniae TaxID=573 RepID=A0A3S4GAW8_KLEPN|nr:L,D-transpeptidase ErfK [Klebsiella pneumoniae]
MLEANPGVDVYLPRSGSTLTIPQQLILPDTVREGIVINVAEMRLYYYPPLAIASKSCQSALVRRDAKRRVTG